MHKSLHKPLKVLLLAVLFSGVAFASEVVCAITAVETATKANTKIRSTLFFIDVTPLPFTSLPVRGSCKSIIAVLVHYLECRSLRMDPDFHPHEVGVGRVLPPEDLDAPGSEVKEVEAEAIGAEPEAVVVHPDHRVAVPSGGVPGVDEDQHPVGRYPQHVVEGDRLPFGDRHPARVIRRRGKCPLRGGLRGMSALGKEN